jgi:hypothetical protein
MGSETMLMMLILGGAAFIYKDKIAEYLKGFQQPAAAAAPAPEATPAPAPAGPQCFTEPGGDRQCVTVNNITSCDADCNTAFTKANGGVAVGEAKNESECKKGGGKTLKSKGNKYCCPKNHDCNDLQARLDAGGTLPVGTTPLVADDTARKQCDQFTGATKVACYKTHGIDSTKGGGGGGNNEDTRVTCPGGSCLKNRPKPPKGQRYAFKLYGSEAEEEEYMSDYPVAFESIDDYYDWIPTVDTMIAEARWDNTEYGRVVALGEKEGGTIHYKPIQPNTPSGFSERKW